MLYYYKILATKIISFLLNKYRITPTYVALALSSFEHIESEFYFWTVAYTSYPNPRHDEGPKGHVVSAHPWHNDIPKCLQAKEVILPLCNQMCG